MSAVPRRLSRLLDGPLPAWPRALDRCSERWASLRPRSRLALGWLAALAVLALVSARVSAAEARWGGTPVPAWVAVTDLAVGAPLRGSVDRVLLPPLALPSRSVRVVPPDGVLALALPQGAVLTQAHLDVRGPGAGLPPDERALPIPIEPGWGIAAGGWVDVWVLGGGDTPAQLVARSRPVLEVRDDDGRGTALVGLAGRQVSEATAGLAMGRVLLTHAPPP